MAALVEGYRCEWKAVVESPELRARFSHFVNTPEPDPSLNFVPKRGQKPPSPWSN
jgi:nitrite reductase (NADH) large subunit